jgi:hypothetical protein
LENSSIDKSSNQGKGSVQSSASQAYSGPVDFPLNKEHLVLGEDVLQSKRAEDFGLTECVGELLVEYRMVETHDGMLQERDLVCYLCDSERLATLNFKQLES